MAGTSRRLARALNIADLRLLARARLPRGVFDYVDGGVEDGLTLVGNRAALDRLTLVPRVLRDVSTIVPGVEVLGQALPLPLAVAPMGGEALTWHDGDLAAARAAAARGIPFTISTASTMEIETIAAAGGTLWFQLYLWAERALSHAAMARAHAAGCGVLMLTVDLPVAPNREYNERNGYGTPFRLGPRNALDIALHPRWLAGVIGRSLLRGGIPQQANLPPHLRGRVTRSAPVGAAFRNDDLSWDEMARLRERWPGRFLVKGVLHPADAERALALGADGVVVSNHGGRALDGAIAAIEALPGIVRAIGGRGAVFFDGGVRRGTDILKALALGADLVLAGRAISYGLAAAGEAGAGRALDLLATEFTRAMALAGCRTVREIDRDLLA